MNRRIVTINDKTFPSIKAACEALKLSPYMIQKHATSIESPKREKRRDKRQVTYQGVTYPTRAAAARELGVNHNKMERMLAMDRGIDEKKIEQLYKPLIIQFVKPEPDNLTAAQNELCKIEAERLNKLATASQSNRTFTADDIQAMFEAVGWKCQDTGTLHTPDTPLCVVLIRPALHGRLYDHNLRVVDARLRFQYPKRSRWNAERAS